MKKKDQQLITVKMFMTEIDAELARGRLISEGIDAFIFRDNCGGMYPPLAFSHGVAVKVPADQAGRAAEVLALSEDPDGTVAAGGVPAESIMALLSVVAWMAGIAGAGLVFLGFFEPSLFSVGAPLLLVGFILAFLTRGVKGP